MLQTVKFGKFSGMNNINEDYELPHDVPRRVVNADVLDSGRLKRREGSSQMLALAKPHSLWGDGGATAYFILNNQVRRFLPDGTSTLVGNFAAGDNRVSYVEVNGEIYLTCKTARGKISSGVLKSWGIDVPASPPVLTTTVGTLPAGTYHASVTYLMADGRESGDSALAKITLAAGGGITTLSMPVSADANVTKKRLYLSTADGEVMNMAAEVAAADQFATCSAQPTGAKLRTAHLTPPPFGKALAYYNGQIFITDAADPRIVWHTEPLDYDHVDTRKNYYQYGEPVTVIAGVCWTAYMCAPTRLTSCRWQEKKRQGSARSVRLARLKVLLRQSQIHRALSG